MTLFIACFIVLFLIGSIPTAYIVTRMISGKDIREHGSGNVGATNALRVLGKGPAAFVFAVDFLKGWLPVYICFHLRIESAPGNIWIWLAAAPVLGHIFTPFLGFKGGKGIATGAGVLLALQPVLFLVAAAVFAVVFGLTRIVALGSLLAVLAAPLAAVFLGFPPAYLKFLVLLALLLVWTHRSNIQRMMAGSEKSITRH